MALIKRDSKLSEIILHDPSTITVLDRFGIALGVGDTTIEQACSQHDIDVNFFVTILNTFINENYFPQQALEQFEVTEIVEYLSKTNSYYEHYILPNIERHFSFLIARAPSHNNNIIIMKQFFDEMKNELIQRINDDRDRLFPEVISNGKTLTTISELSHTEQATDTIEDKIDDLINMIIMHLKGDYDHNLGYAVIVAIFSLKKDIKQNNRIRERILLPIYNSLTPTR